jgi:exopolyphosphatase / guanosine-5'-triphosphate,3'-diphosphate pyrophosphatase
MTRVAAIDCGTNSIRLLVADVPTDPTGEPTDVLRRMEIVRLGQGVDRTGRLAPESIERTRRVLARYVEQIAELGATAVRMVATSATRDAVNAADFEAMVVATLGARPEVITGAEEARLSFTGAVRGLAGPDPTRYLVVDIGGGSTEFVLGESAPPGRPGAGPTVSRAASVDIGCVRMTERHLHDDPPTAAQIAAARADIGHGVDRALTVLTGPAPAGDPTPALVGSAGLPALVGSAGLPALVGSAGLPALVGSAGLPALVGLAGSVTTVTALALRLPAYQPARIHHAVIGYAQVADVTRDLLAMTRADRLGLPAMHPGRADVIGAGALVLCVLMEKLAVPTVMASEHDILDGIAYGLAQTGSMAAEPS